MRELTSLQPGITRAETEGACGCLKIPNSRFAYVYHQKNSPVVKVYFRRPPDVPLQDVPPEISIEERSKVSGTWAKAFPAYFLLADQAALPSAARFLIAVAFPQTVSHTTIISERRFDKAEICESVQPPPARIECTTTRIIRDTAKSLRLKHKYDYRCQLCGERIELDSSSFYAEVHHIRPLGGNHLGSDSRDNMLVVCPTHHAMFDLRLAEFITEEQVKACGKLYKLTLKHKISSDNINYNNASVASRRE